MDCTNRLPEHSNTFEAIDEAVNIGCSALYFHGGDVDECYSNKDEKSIRYLVLRCPVCRHTSWCSWTRPRSALVGRQPRHHGFSRGASLNCGSLHDGKGDKFKLGDIAPAIECIRRIRKPKIAYKIMGAGRINSMMAFEHAFAGIKPTDVVNVGMHRGDKDNMVEENAAIQLSGNIFSLITNASTSIEKFFEGEIPI